MRNSTKAKSTPGMDKQTITVEKHCTQPEAYTRGIAFNRRQRKENQRIDREAEAWRGEDLTINTQTITLEINGVLCTVERALGYHLLSTSECRYIGADNE